MTRAHGDSPAREAVPGISSRSVATATEQAGRIYALAHSSSPSALQAKSVHTSLTSSTGATAHASPASGSLPAAGAVQETDFAGPGSVGCWRNEAGEWLGCAQGACRCSMLDSCYPRSDSRASLHGSTNVGVCSWSLVVLAIASGISISVFLLFSVWLLSVIKKSAGAAPVREPAER
eukprot:TRINITY_DN31442_c0_g1_i2.p1 TRINITY_DN31442_c0_g1~~TRINITY_DN31442_c0_g1_i2.p1  ORF type:complete len:177 (-),score=24.21 TRINITY_DN31442_c0_g1_i2:268-798(-)